jgi:hypothetical protein
MKLAHKLLGFGEIFDLRKFRIIIATYELIIPIPYLDSAAKGIGPTETDLINQGATH